MLSSVGQLHLFENISISDSNFISVPRWHFDAVADRSIGLHLSTFLQVAGRLVG